MSEDPKLKLVDVPSAEGADDGMPSDEELLREIEAEEKPEATRVLDLRTVVAQTLNADQPSPFVSERMMKVFVRKEMIRQNKHLQEAFNQHEHRWVEYQMRMNGLWNSINAIVKALYNEGLITNEKLEKAGYELALDARRSMQEIMAAKREKRPMNPALIAMSALDEADKAVKPAMNKTIGELRRIVDSYEKEGQ